MTLTEAQSVIAFFMIVGIIGILRWIFSSQSTNYFWMIVVGLVAQIAGLIYVIVV